ncbi:hypothetical protein EMIT0P44_20125 [Pseudomonas sp. IT-P44]
MAQRYPSKRPAFPRYQAPFQSPPSTIGKLASLCKRLISQCGTVLGVRKPPHTTIKSKSEIRISVNGVSGLIGIPKSLMISELFLLKVEIFTQPGRI